MNIQDVDGADPSLPGSESVTTSESGPAATDADADARRAAAAERRKARKAARAARPLPERDPLYDGHCLGDLRAARSRLVEEETRVSYWRRVDAGTARHRQGRSGRRRSDR